MLLLSGGEILIIKNKNICGGTPTISGTRIPVTLVLANIRDEVAFEDICNDYHITLEDIRDSLKYAMNDIECKDTLRGLIYKYKNELKEIEIESTRVSGDEFMKGQVDMLASVLNELERIC